MFKALLCVTGFLLQWARLSLKWTLEVEQKGLGGLVKHGEGIRFSGPPAVLFPADYGAKKHKTRKERSV